MALCESESPRYQRELGIQEHDETLAIRPVDEHDAVKGSDEHTSSMAQEMESLYTSDSTRPTVRDAL